MKELKMNKKTVYYEWGTFDSRIKKHLMITYLKSTKQNGKTKYYKEKSYIYCSKNDYMDTLITIANIANKDLKEIDFYKSINLENKVIIKGDN